MIGWEVDAKPEPQGSHKIGRRGERHVVLHANDRTLKVWRQRVGACTFEAWWKAGKPRVLDQPVVLVATFRLARPASGRWHLTWPGGPPDLSKLVRATEDGIVQDCGAMCGHGKGLLRDDALIVQLVASKRWVHDGEQPGASLELWTVPEWMDARL